MSCGAWAVTIFCLAMRATTPSTGVKAWTWLFGGAHNDWLYGGSEHDILYGGDGFDYLNGGFGADNMYGGALNDTYWVDEAGDVVVEYAGEGHDHVSRH